MATKITIQQAVNRYNTKNVLQSKETLSQEELTQLQMLQKWWTCLKDVPKARIVSAALYGMSEPSIRGTRKSAPLKVEVFRVEFPNPARLTRFGEFIHNRVVLPVVLPVENLFQRLEDFPGKISQFLQRFFSENYQFSKEGLAITWRGLIVIVCVIIAAVILL